METRRGKRCRVSARLSSTVIPEMDKSPAYSFIREYIELEFEKIEKDKITPWAFLLSGKGLKLTDFFGKEITYAGVEFEGSPREKFWKGFIQPFLEEIVSKSFSETRSFCQTHGVDLKLPLEETASLLKASIERVYQRMSDIDQRLRGKGYPDSVPRYNPEAEEAYSKAFVEERMCAELALTPKRRKTLNTFYEEQKFWFWFIGIVVAIIGVLIKVFG
jgi:hypothetical protein